MRFLIPIVLLGFYFNQLFAQIPVGTWRDHLPYNNGKVVAVAGNRVYCATDLALFYYDISENAVYKLSKINKLSDLEVGYISYNEPTNKLVIGYLNGNIDILEGDTKYNFPDIKLKNIIADKAIYHIMTHDKFAYLSTGFGIVVFNLEKNEFTDSYIIGAGGSYMKINSTAIYNDTIYALTDKGIYRAGLQNPFLGNFENWHRVNEIMNPSAKFTVSSVFNNKLYVVNGFNGTDSCLVNTYNGTVWDTTLNKYRGITAMTVTNNTLTLSAGGRATAFNSSLDVVKTFKTGFVQHAIFDKNENLWMADSKAGLVWHCDRIYQMEICPSGPVSKNVFKVYNNNGSILVAPGGYGNSFFHADVFKFNSDTWTNLTENDSNTDSLESLRNVVDFASMQNASGYVAATYGYGIFEVKDDKITHTYNAKNTDSILGNFIGGMTYDKNGNLFIMSNYADYPFVVKTPDNKWYHYAYDGSWIDTRLNCSRKLICTNNNDKWTISTQGKGIFVFNDNGTPENDNDDTYKKFDVRDESNSIIDNRLNDIVQDAEGAIWIATSNGVAVYDYPEYALQQDNHSFYARRPQIVVEGYLKGLLEGENVTCIAVDGANRKWLGTEGGGLFLVSPDGTEQLMIWNTDNSKLLSNNIVSVDINQKTGEVFIGTDKGLESYKSTSTESKADYSNIYAFPNPVKGDYNGVITIRGLMYESNVKITDMAGNLVFETTSNGGDAIWNGRDMSGEAVAPGIYLVMCSQSDGSVSEVTKILFLK